MSRRGPNAARERAVPAPAPLSARSAAWAWGEARLRAAGIPPEEARLEAEVLLRRAARISREELFARPGGPVPPGAGGAYARAIASRAAGRPTAYLVGRREFFGLDLRVDGRVLIPRPETERLVEVVRDALRGCAAPLIVDIGTGSGAVAIALARLIPDARFVATDTSPGALALARRNAEALGVAARIEWAAGHATDPLARRGLEGRVDALASNPPYIATADLAGLPSEVRDHEPPEALDGGPDGLDVHRAIVAGAGSYLCAGGLLALEVAATGEQARAVAALIAARGGYETPAIVRDYAGAERIVAARRMSR